MENKFMSDNNYGYNPIPEANAPVYANRPLASRGRRLGASLIDGFLPMAGLIPFLVMLLLTGSSYEAGSALTVIFALFSGLSVTGIAIYGIVLMVTRSQSIGKRILNIVVFDYDTDVRASAGKVFGMRSLVNGLICSVPYLGSLYALIDILFIFGEEKRCLHDRLANTRVVVAQPYDFG